MRRRRRVHGDICVLWFNEHAQLAGAPNERLFDVTVTTTSTTVDAVVAGAASRM